MFAALQVLPPGFSWPLLSLGGALVVSVAVAWSYARRCRKLRRDKSELQEKLSRSQFRSEVEKLRPHFLFNTLDLISSLVHEDAKRAEDSILSLSRMLRISLKNSGRSEIRLEEELEFLDHYLAIVEARFGSKVTTEIAVDPACLDAMVPELLLQPLVENSLRHGAAKRSCPHRIRIVGQLEGTRIHLEVSDDGPGAPDLAAGSFKEGLGLGAIRRRLDLLYGQDHRFEIRNGPAEGVTVSADFPFRTKQAHVN